MWTEEVMSSEHRLRWLGLTVTALLSALIIALVCSMLFASRAQATGLVVNSLDDAPDANVGDGLCATAGGACTLRAALQEANANGATADTITFSVAGTISLTTGLPWLSAGNTTIAGANQTVTVDGSSLVGPHCFDITSAGNTIRGLVIRCRDNAIYVTGAGSTIGGTSAAERNVITNGITAGIHLRGSGAHDNHVVGNYIGVDVNGTAAGNGLGVLVEAGAWNNVVGGSIAGERNVISGNRAQGVEIKGEATSDNRVIGNYIGTNAAGTQALPNQYDGVEIWWGAPNNTVEGNVISGNGDQGVQIGGGVVWAPSGTRVIGNYIGTNAAGNLALPNQGDGVEVDGQNNIIGGASEAERNVISGNGDCGVELWGDDATVSGNYVGTNATGDAALPNGCGVSVLSHNNTIGGATAGERNVISGNEGIGVSVGATNGNRVTGDYIGTNAAGDTALPNGSDGVWVYGENNTVGGSSPGEGNVISGNEGAGVALHGSGNRVSGNHIGTDAAGDAIVPNFFWGVEIWPGANDNTIGGASEGERNVISGNSAGVHIHGGSRNRVSGNYIGVNAAGDAALPNRSDGVNVWESGAQDNIIGGSTPGERNVISGNFMRGVRIDDASGTKVSGNYIGTNARGDAAIPNGPDPVFIHQGYGVWVWTWAQNTIIGGASPGERNLISGNGSTGVVIAGDDTWGTRVLGNYIGTSAAGDVALPNQGAGVWVWDGAPDTIIGGSAAGERNVISGNAGAGVEVGWLSTVATGLGVTGNYIGTNATGNAALPNQGDGVFIGEGSHTIGGAASGERNTIAFNNGDGVRVDGAIGNTITGNSIHSNGGKGIENVDGGNTELPPPIIDSVGGSVCGHTDPRCYPCTVEVFSDDGDEGRIYHGSTTTNDDATGTWCYPGAVSGPYVTATITDASGNTSEFSLRFAYEPGDVDCDDDVDAVNALFILQYVVGMRNGSDQCPPPPGSIYLPGADADCDGDVDAVDALFVLQHVVGLRPVLCPDTSLPTPVALAIADLAGRLGIPQDAVRVVEAREVVWSNSCLGVGFPGLMCLMVITPGYWLQLEALVTGYIYHTDCGSGVIATDLAEAQGAIIDSPPPPSPGACG